MILKINHQTTYAFSAAVFLEPHLIRLYPRRTAFSHLQEFHITISPKPTGIRLQEDEEGNWVHFCWFDPLTNALAINTAITVQSNAYNPFDFLVYPGERNKLPFEYSPEEQKALHRYLNPLAASAELVTYGQQVETASNHETIPFLMNLTRKIHSDFGVIYRKEGPPYHPDETFTLKSGSCRDLAWMQINLLRNWGFAARFVSGYYFFEIDPPDFELHGWLEVFIPGAGWIGYDPSHGIMTGNTHIPLATGANVRDTMPVSGTFRGSATSDLKTRVVITSI